MSYLLPRPKTRQLLKHHYQWLIYNKKKYKLSWNSSTMHNLAAKRKSCGVYCWRVATQHRCLCSMILIYLRWVVHSVLIQPPLGTPLIILQFAYWSYVGCGILFLEKLSIICLYFMLLLALHYSCRLQVLSSMRLHQVQWYITKKKIWGDSS